KVRKRARTAQTEKKRTENDGKGEIGARADVHRLPGDDPEKGDAARREERGGKDLSGFFGQGAGAGRVYLQQAGMREEARKAEAFEQGVFRGGAARSVREARGGVFWKRVKSGHIWGFACARERSPWASIGR